MKRATLNTLLLTPLFLAGHAWAGPIQIVARFVPPTITVGQGETFQIDVVADTNEPIVGWGFDLSIADSTIAAQAELPTIGPAWFAAAAGDGDNLAGLAFPNGIVGDGLVLATLTFVAEHEGSTELILSHSLDDPSEGFALDPMGLANVNYLSGQITVLPEPQTIFSMLLMILITKPRSRRRFAGLHRKIRSAAY